MPFADLPSRIIVANNPGPYAAPTAENVMAMTLALANACLLKTRNFSISKAVGEPRYVSRDGLPTPGCDESSSSTPPAEEAHWARAEQSREAWLRPIVCR